MQVDDSSSLAVKNEGASNQPVDEDAATRFVPSSMFGPQLLSLSLSKREARVLLPTDDGTHQLKTVEHKKTYINDSQDTDEEQDENEEEEDGDAEDTDYLADFPDETDVRRLPVHFPMLKRLCFHWQELELVHCRIKSLDELHLARFAPNLRRLCLRQNAISRLNSETFHQLTKLEEVDFYDNKLKDVGDAFDKLSVVKCVSSHFCMDSIFTLTRP